MATETCFAEIDANGIVLRVIDASQAFIDSGKVGPAANWVQSFPDGSARKNHAAAGYTYDKATDRFVPPQPFPSWTLDAATAQWQCPVARPAGRVDWDEAKQKWVATPAAVQAKGNGA